MKMWTQSSFMVLPVLFARADDVRFRILHSNQLFPRTQLPVDVGESRFEDITDWLPRAAVELN
jgi:hypothetical protein